jgi:GNAT superfamily N-acetyltransferase
MSSRSRVRAAFRWMEVSRPWKATSSGLPSHRWSSTRRRLAVDRACQERGLGAGLLRDAILRILQAAQFGGIRAILVHAISTEAKRFYERHGFVESPVDPMTLMITVADAKRALGGA